MKFSEALKQAQKILQTAQIETAYLDALLLLIFATGLTKEQIIFNTDAELTVWQYEDFMRAIARRERREPVSHIVGKREFYSLDFFVSGDVLDPRPDSESLVEMVLQNFSSKKIYFLEIGVGSGCLTISILKNLPDAVALGVDISVKALEICQKNAQFHQVQDRFLLLQSNLFSEIQPQKFDLIISNPPYIARDEIEKLAPEVKLHEPITALDGGIDGLDFYRRIAAEALNFLNPQGKVIIEIGAGQEKEITEIFARAGFELCEEKYDLAGKIRVLEFKKK